jgi:hypothetical protein
MVFNPLFQFAGARHSLMFDAGPAAQPVTNEDFAGLAGILSEIRLLFSGLGFGGRVVFWRALAAGGKSFFANGLGRARERRCGGATDMLPF